MKNIVIAMFTLFSFFSFAGPRVVGNGGDVLSALPIDQDDLVETIKNARPSLRFWLYHQEGRLLHRKPSGNMIGITPPAGAEKLFSKTFLAKNIYELMDAVIVMVPMSSYCGDTQHTQKDGTTVFYLPPRICLSGFSLLQKLDAYNLKIQVEALMLHELSHWMGANEHEAVALQREYVHDMKNFSLWALRREVSQKWDLLDRLEGPQDPQALTLLLSDLRKPPKFSSLQFFSMENRTKIQQALDKGQLDLELLQTLRSDLQSDLREFSKVLLQH